MTTEGLVTPALREQVGRWTDVQTSPEICASDIRRWAIATHWPEPPPRIYWDEEHAAATRSRGIVAPPDFNPFAWPVARTAPPEMREAGPGGIQLATMNGGQTDTFGEPMRPGDRITARSRILDLDEKIGRLGPMLFIRSEIEWINQSGAFVKRRISTRIRYVPAEAG